MNIPERYKSLIQDLNTVSVLDDGISVEKRIRESEFEFQVNLKKCMIRLPKSGARTTPPSINIKSEVFNQLNRHERTEFSNELSKEGIVISNFNIWTSFLFLNYSKFFYLYAKLTDKQLI